MPDDRIGKICVVTDGVHGFIGTLVDVKDRVYRLGHDALWFKTGPWAEFLTDGMVEKLRPIPSVEVAGSCLFIWPWHCEFPPIVKPNTFN